MNNQQQNGEDNVVRRYTLDIFDITEDENTGKQMLQRVSYSQPVVITASSQAELRSKLALYDQTHQKAVVVAVNPPFGTPVQQQNAPQQQKPINMPQISQHPQQAVRPPASGASSEPDKPVDSKPQYFKIGEVEIKIENGISYQKQFVRLTESEASNIRVVDNKTGRVSNLNGKHLEMKKWIRVESEQSNDEVKELETALIPISYTKGN